MLKPSRSQDASVLKTRVSTRACPFLRCLESRFAAIRITTGSQERQGVPARCGGPARGIPTATPPTVRESHEPGPPLEPGPHAPCPFLKRRRKGEGSRPKGGVPARRGVGVPARGILQPIRGQGAWEYHEPGPPTSRDPSHFPRFAAISNHDSIRSFESLVRLYYFSHSRFQIARFDSLAIYNPVNGEIVL